MRCNELNVCEQCIQHGYTESVVIQSVTYPYQSFSSEDTNKCLQDLAQVKQHSLDWEEV